jgi:hypothetical protein
VGEEDDAGDGDGGFDVGWGDGWSEEDRAQRDAGDVTRNLIVDAESPFDVSQSANRIHRGDGESV